MCFSMPIEECVVRACVPRRCVSVCVYHGADLRWSQCPTMAASRIP